jgi:hypothetical protein
MKRGAGHIAQSARLLQLATMFGLSLTVPSLAAKAPAAPLTADELNLIGEVSELIIPTTDTGGRSRPACRHS